MSPKVFDKICFICGDKASGFHFDVITCESCKSFFRRNAFRNKSLKCFLGGECKIDVLSRTFCKKCRLSKCFENGMKIEFILSEEQRKIRKSIIEENRRRKVNNNENNSKTINSVNTSNGETKRETTPSSQCLTSNYSDRISSEESLFQIQNCATNGKQFTDVLKIGLTINFEEPVVVIQRPITDFNKIFNELEANRLTELFSALKIMSEPSVSASYPVINFWDAIQVMHQKLDLDIRKLIKMSKSLIEFRGLTENDQIVLLKFASIEIVIIRMVLYFNFQFEYWNIITNSNKSNLIKLELFKNNKRNTYENHKHFIENFGPTWDSDPTIIDLLTVILLFNPNRPKLINKNLIKLQQQIYMHLLQRYLLLKYQSESESEHRFAKILNSLTDLHILNEKIRLNCLEGPFHGIPLLEEICDRDPLFN